MVESELFGQNPEYGAGAGISPEIIDHHVTVGKDRIAELQRSGVEPDDLPFTVSSRELTELAAAMVNVPDTEQEI